MKNLILFIAVAVVSGQLLWATEAKVAKLTFETGSNSAEWRNLERQGLLPYHKLTEEDYPVRSTTAPTPYIYTMGFTKYVYHCQTTSGPTYQAKLTKLQVWTGFNRNLSWRKEGSAQATNYLTHEQGHLDINSLNAWEFSRKIQSQSLVGTGRSAGEARRNLDVIVKSIFQNIDASNELEQQKYDYETNGGDDVTGQARWSAEINQRLERAGIYAK